MHKTWIVLLLVLVSQASYAIVGNGTIYAIGSIKTSLVGGNGSGIIYESESITDWTPVGYGNGSLYSGIDRFFLIPEPNVEIVEGGGSSGGKEILQEGVKNETIEIPQIDIQYQDEFPYYILIGLGALAVYSQKEKIIGSVYNEEKEEKKHE